MGSMTVGVVASGDKRGQAMAVSVAKFETPDGRLIEIKGKPDLRVTWRGNMYHFKYPVQASLKGGRLIIKSSNRALTAFPLREIQRLEVSQPNGAANGLLGALGGLGLAGLILLIILAL